VSADESPQSSETDAPLLSVEDLRTQFRTPRGTMRAVDGVSFELERGRTFGVVGESGSGKSVLVRTIMNLLPPNAVVPDSGVVRYRGTDIRTLSPTGLRNLWGPEIAMVFQDPMTALNPVRKIGAQLTEAMRFHLRVSKGDARDRAVELMREVGIPSPAKRLDQYPHELSGGMRQRVVIASALSCEPTLLIADEPTTALDVTVQRQILELLARLRDEHGMAMILISHDMGVVSGMADQVAVMYAGQFVETAPTDRLFGSVHHPYTEALLASIPDVSLTSKTRLRSIEGRPPDMVDVEPGCRFAPRCVDARSDCRRQVPALVEAAHATHRYRCFHPIDVAVRKPSDEATTGVV